MNKEKILQELKDWDANAEYYDLVARQPFRLIIEREMLRAYLLNGCQTIVDLGCGTCHFSHSLKKLGKNVISIDFSSEMLQRAKNFDSSLVCIRASADKLPLRPRSFDAIIANSLFHHLKAQGILNESLLELIPLLKKDGVICFLDRGANPVATALMSIVIVLKAIVRKLMGHFSECGSRSEVAFSDEDIYLLVKGGFKVERRVSIVSIPFQVLIWISNGLHYLSLHRLDRVFQCYLSPLAEFLEARLNPKHFSMEQCVKLRHIS